MATMLCTLRHGRATGQGPDAALLPEGEAAVARLGRRLAREGLRPVAAYSSPYRRARETAAIVLGELACGLDPVLLEALAPDTEPAEALEALRAHGLPDGAVLVVTHLPLVGRLAGAIAGATLDFPPGAWAEYVLAPGGRTGTFRRWLGPGGDGG